MHGLLNREYFRAETTQKDDYRVPQLTNEIEDYVICAEKPDPSRKRIPSCPKDYETLKTHGRTIPFSLFYRPKEIVKTNPHTTCIQKIKTGDDQLEYARSLRSRRMFPPAFPVDDLEKMLDDKDVIASIRCYPYWSDYTANFRQFYPMATPKDDATSTLEKKANMVKHTAQEPTPPIPKGWANAATQWDRRQNRAECEPTNAFWAYYSRQCIPNEDLCPTLKQEIRDLAHNWKLTEPYTMPVSTYAGFLPNMPKGVPMRKSKKCSHDPRASMYQAMTARAQAKGEC